MLGWASKCAVINRLKYNVSNKIEVYFPIVEVSRKCCKLTGGRNGGSFTSNS